MVSRRTFLAGAGTALAPLAGCVSVGDGGPDDESTNADDPTGTPDDPPEGGISVRNVGVLKAITYESTMGSGGVLTTEGSQYVVASVDANSEVSASMFDFAADGGSWDPGLSDTAGGINRSVAGREGMPVGSGTHESGVRAFLAFVVPSPLSASSPRIRFDDGWETREWKLDAGDRERLAAPEPRFELQRIDVPEGVRQGDPLEVSLTVGNVSEVDGRFLAAMYWPTEGIADDDESHIVDRDVAAGESVTVSRSIDTRYTTMEGGTVSFRVRGHVRADRDVDVRTPSTPS